MTNWACRPHVPLAVNEDGHHPCWKCGWVWFDTQIVLGDDGRVIAHAVTDAACASCGERLEGLTVVE